MTHLPRAKRKPPVSCDQQMAIHIAIDADATLLTVDIDRRLIPLDRVPGIIGAMIADPGNRLVADAERLVAEVEERVPCPVVVLNFAVAQLH